MKLIIDISDDIYDTIMSDLMPTEGQISAIVTRIYQGIPLSNEGGEPLNNAYQSAPLTKLNQPMPKPDNQENRVNRQGIGNLQLAISQSIILLSV